LQDQEGNNNLVQQIFSKVSQSSFPSPYIAEVHNYTCVFCVFFYRFDNLVIRIEGLRLVLDQLARPHVEVAVFVFEQVLAKVNEGIRLHGIA
jgi:hypothetical protein